MCNESVGLKSMVCKVTSAGRYAWSNSQRARLSWADKESEQSELLESSSVEDSSEICIGP